MVKEDSLHHMDLFDMGFMVIWRCWNSSYSPKNFCQDAYSCEDHISYRKKGAKELLSVDRFYLSLLQNFKFYIIFTL